MPREQRERQNIIADHARAVTFLINDGVYPSNNDRGYVLRFLIRRAIRNGRLLGYPNGFLTELVPAVVKSLEPAYPELRANLSRIQSALRSEETTFDRTLERGMAMVDRLIDDAITNCTRLISGEDAFMLHDTFGFPIELTREIAGEQGAAVDTVGFAEFMQEQRARARADAAAKREVVTLAELPAIKTEFTGYDGLEAEGDVIAILRDDKPVQSLAAGERGILLLDRTSFYAERGGQIGDRGTISCEGGLFEVDDTQYMGEAVAHSGTVKSGEISIGERVTHDGLRLVAARDPAPPYLGASLAARAEGCARRRRDAGGFVGRHRPDALRFPLAGRRALARAEARRRASRERDDSRRRAPRDARYERG